MERIEFGFFDAGGGHRAAATALDRWPSEAQQRPWEVHLTNLQELLDALDILKKYAGIRIEDFYNWMLRQRLDTRQRSADESVAVCDSVVSCGRRCACWSALERDRSRTWWFRSFRISIARWAKAFANAYPGRPFVTVLTDIADYPPHFWIERQQHISDLRLRSRGRTGARAWAHATIGFFALRE